MRTRSRWRPGGRCYGSSKRESWCKQRIRSKPEARDRKSTRLNSSHSQISYAVFCLKKNNFAKSLDFLGMFPPMREDQTISEMSMTKAVRVGCRAIVFQLKPTGTIKMPRLKYTLFADHPFSRGLTEVVIDRISFFLSLSDDLDQFYRIAINDSNFAPVLQKLYGLHQVKFLTPFECACW